MSKLCIAILKRLSQGSDSYYGLVRYLLANTHRNATYREITDALETLKDDGLIKNLGGSASAWTATDKGVQTAKELA